MNVCYGCHQDALYNEQLERISFQLDLIIGFMERRHAAPETAQTDPPRVETFDPPPVLTPPSLQPPPPPPPPPASPSNDAATRREGLLKDIHMELQRRSSAEV